jgi:hypothetical protein
MLCGELHQLNRNTPRTPNGTPTSAAPPALQRRPRSLQACCGCFLLQPSRWRDCKLHTAAAAMPAQPADAAGCCAAACCCPSLTAADAAGLFSRRMLQLPTACTSTSTAVEPQHCTASNSVARWLARATPARPRGVVCCTDCVTTARRHSGDPWLRQTVLGPCNWSVSYQTMSQAVIKPLARQITHSTSHTCERRQTSVVTPNAPRPRLTMPPPPSCVSALHVVLLKVLHHDTCRMRKEGVCARHRSTRRRHTRASLAVVLQLRSAARCTRLTTC